MPLSISTQLIIEAARARNWRVQVLNEKTNLLHLVTDTGVTYYLRNNTTHKGSGVNEYLAKHKQLFSQLLANVPGVTQPASEMYENLEKAISFLNEYGQVVVKPADLSHGNGVTINVTTPEQLHAAIEVASQLSSQVILQQHISGPDYRVLLIGGKISAAAIREPASVTGDGQHTIRELIKIENLQADRGIGYTLKKSHIDAAVAEHYLGIHINDVPHKDEKTTVIGVANIGRGGLSIDVTDQLSQEIIDQSHLIVEHFKFELVGIDFIVDETNKPYLIEVNTRPSFGLHAHPAEGKPRPVADDFLDWLIR